ncbi:MAG: LysR family transcriptional regulator [Myxococcales bacterium]|nr:LysR family transcriptional regulator [Myxococcales bacterium]
MDIDSLRVFLKVADLGSLTHAGAHLGIPKSSVSRKVSALESEIGARLFHRSTRVVRLTPDGETLLARARRIVREADEIGALFRPGARLRGRVHVDMPVNIARRFVLPSLPDLLERHRELDLVLSTTDRIVDVLREGFDCVLRVGVSSDSDLMQRKLGELSMVNCVSRSYADRHGVPTTLDELSEHRLVHYTSRLEREPPQFEYELEGETHQRPMTAAVTVNNTDAYSAACRAGLGIVQTPLIGMREHLDRGTVVEVLPQYRCAPMPVVMLHTHGRRPPQRVRVVMEWVADALQGRLE